jgi:hypothetical protein
VTGKSNSDYLVADLSLRYIFVELHTSGFFNTANGKPLFIGLTRIIHEASTAAAHPGLSTALRSVGFLDVQSSTGGILPSRWPKRQMRLVATPVFAASIRTFMDNPG